MRAELAYSRPPIWRRLELASDLRLDELHRVLQAAFEWYDGHLHRFAAGDRTWEPAANRVPGLGFARPPESTSRTRLGDVLTAVGDSLEYLYDFGDDWRHVLTVEDVSSLDAAAPRASVVAGRRSAPPEDCGGIPGYYALLDAIEKRDDPASADLVDWAAEALGDLDSFDPSQFDVADANGRVQEAAD